MTSQHSGAAAGGDERAAAGAFGKAVAAYAREDFAAAVGHLRLLDRDGPVPAHRAAAHAALHGALAARVRDWGRCYDWYLASLAPHDARLTLQVSGPCSVADCGSVAASRCGQCGGGCCFAHGVRHGDGAHRCLPCLNLALTNLAQAAVLTARTAEAVRVLRSWARPGDPSAASELLRGLAPADRAETDSLVSAFFPYGTRAAPPPPAHRTSRQHVCTLALHRALTRGGYPEWERVGRPTARDIQGHASALYGQSSAGTARRLTAAGNHLGAWRHWLAIWRTRPFDLASAHGLGVAALRLLASGAPLDRDDRLAATRQSVTCWAAALHSPACRAAMREVCGEDFEDGVWATAVDDLRSRITQLCRDQDRAGGTAPHRSLELRWRLECEAASRWAALPARDAPAPAAPGFFCGPLYLDEVGTLGANWSRRVRELRDAMPRTRPAGQGGLVPAELFGPDAVLATLLREGRWQEVIDAVEETRPDWRVRAAAARSGTPAGSGRSRPDRTEADDEAAALRFLGTAHARRAGEHARGRRWSQALGDFEEALRAGQDVTRYADEICRAAVGAGTTVRGQVKEGHAQAGFLERGLRLVPGDRELMRNLTAVSLRLAEQAERRGHREEAERRYRRARELSPEDPQARAGLARTARAPGAPPAPPAPAPPPPPSRPATGTATGTTPVGAGAGARNVPSGVGSVKWLIAEALHQEALGLARAGRRDKALAVMREAASRLTGHPDARFSGESPEVDVARGLWRERRPYRAYDEPSLRAHAETLWLSLSYHPLEENTGLPDVLAKWASALLARSAYDEIIALRERCTGAEGDLTEFHEVLVHAYRLRAMRRRRADDPAGAERDSEAARAVQGRDRPRKQDTSEVDPPEGV
ncbi:hypothetical protein [Streptomyces cremeus]|uniref:Tetratricopeptide repeat protein n=1 Tax=Streptomyces cremeus TaxID=66881 RepID=A0ABV5PB56_STRCM